MWRDVRQAWRGLAARPAFAAAAALSLALGIGANAAIFSLVDQVLVRALPVKEPERLVVLRSEGPRQGRSESDNNETVFSYPMYRDLRDRGREWIGLIARAAAPVHAGWRDQNDRAGAEIVSGNFFEVLGVQALVGRTLTSDDDRTPGAHPVVVLGYGYWQRRFGGNPAVVGEKIQVNGHPMTILGVAPARFYGVMSGRTPDLYIPIRMKRLITPTWDGLESRRVMWLNILGRLAPGQTARRVEAAMAPVYRPILEQELAEMGRPRSTRFREQFLAQKLELKEARQGIHQLRRFWEMRLVALMGMVGLVLLIACANVANLLLARGAEREREMAIRLAMGAGRWGVVRQLLVESLLLAAAGGAAGLLLGAWSAEGLLRLLPEGETGGQLSGGMDLRVALFGLAVSAVSAVLFSVAPAWQAARSDVAPALKDEATTASGGSRQARFRKALVAAQVALAVVLAAGAGLFTRSLENLLRFDPGFRVENLTMFSLDPRLSGYTPARTQALAAELQQRFEIAAVAKLGPLTNSGEGSNITVEGYRAREDEDLNVGRNVVSPGYFRTMGIPLVTGREFAASDGPAAPQVVIVNEAFARYFFGSAPSAIGRRMTFGAGTVKLDREIVGVVADSKHETLREKTKWFVYTAFAQDDNPGRMTFFVRSAATPEVRRLVRELDPGLPVFGLKSVRAQLGETIYWDRVVAVVSVAFGALATLLAAVGLYGVIAYAVARRTREIGIRMALGATRGRVVQLVLREVAGFATVGIGIGVAAAVAGGRWVESELFGVRSADPVVLAGAAAALALVALAAGGLPARRAARLDPMAALRHE
jgi:predicted permease